MTTPVFPQQSPVRASPFLIAVFGPTGSGKSELAEALADRITAALINADAFQVYRGLDIGTNKSGRKGDYALIDIKSPHEGYGVGEFVQDANHELARIYEQGKNAIVVGGTGLYIRALFEEYRDLAPAPSTDLREKLQAAPLVELLADLDRLSPGLRIDRHNRIRVQRALERALAPTAPIDFRLPPFRKVKLGLEIDPLKLGNALDRRVLNLLDKGWIGEVQGLLSMGVLEDSPAFRAIGYAEISQYLSDKLTFEGLVETIQLQTRQYAKRQRAWMRSEPNLVQINRAKCGPVSTMDVEMTLQRINELTNQG